MSPRSQHLLFITLMVAAMSCVISLTLTLIKVGFDHSLGYLINQWLRNWALAALVAWPTAYIVVPAVRKIVTKLARGLPWVGRDSIAALLPKAPLPLPYTFRPNSAHTYLSNFFPVGHAAKCVSPCGLGFSTLGNSPAKNPLR